jgi:hypothetical protein
LPQVKKPFHAPDQEAMRPFALQVVWLVRALRVGLQDPALKMQTLSDAVQDTA